MKILYCLLLIFSWPNLVAAEVKVVVAFDEDGHRLHRVVAVKDDRLSALIRSIQQTADTGSFNRGLSGTGSGDARQVWFDQNGRTIAAESLQDPRLVHAPIGKTSSDRSWIEYAIREQGVYVLRGPGLATAVEVFLPELRLIDRILPAEKWILKVGSQGRQKHESD